MTQTHADAVRPDEPDAGPVARIEPADLVEEGSFVPLGAGAAGGAGAGVAGGPRAGSGTVDGRDVLVHVDGDGACVARVLDLARRAGRPVIAVHHGGGAAIGRDRPDAADDVAARGRALRAAIRCSGVVPQVAVVVGAPTREQAWWCALADLVVGVGPGPYDPELVHHLAVDVDDAVDWAQDALSFLPADHRGLAPRAWAPDEAEDVDPAGLLAPEGVRYDVRDVVDALTEDFLEVGAHHAGAVVTGFARLDGRSVGVVATAVTGDRDDAGATRAARFVRTCDRFNLPLLTLVDGEALASVTQEGAAGAGSATAAATGVAALLHAYGGASVPLVTLLVRPVPAGARVLLAALPLADVTLAWPAGRLAVEDLVVQAGHLPGEAGDSGDPASAAVDVAAREALHWQRFDALLHRAAEEGEAARSEAVRLGLVDAVVEPSRTRRHLRAALRLLETRFPPIARESSSEIAFPRRFAREWREGEEGEGR